MTSFADLGVPARLVNALTAEGIVEPFPVQAATLPDALAGKDVCGRAPTGSGKTLGFGIPLMTRIGQAEPNRPTGLVLVPTRELAEQVQRAMVPLGRAQWRFIQAIYGGAAFGPQIHSLRKGCSVVVATPGRLLDLVEQGHCDLSAVEVCVIDEADRMADLGFMPDLRKILDMTPQTRQTMLWSATLDGDVDELIRDYLRDPVRHDLVGDVDSAPVEHRFVVTRPTERLDAAVALIEEHGPTVVFVKTRFGVDDVAADLNRAGVAAGALHGARSQALRQRTLEDFKRGRVQALVATDVAARGIHVDNVSLVLHYDMPDNDKDYTHRSGRTGRAGNAGVVIAFVPPSRQRIARRMSDSISADVTWHEGDTPTERVPRAERETGQRNRGDRDQRPPRDDRPSRPRPHRDERNESRGPRTDWSPRPRRDDTDNRGPRNDWSPRPNRDGSDNRGPRTDWSPRPRRDGSDNRGPRNDWSPRPNREGSDNRGPRNDWSPRPSRDGSDNRAPRSDWSPRPRREGSDNRGPRNDWSPRPRRDERTDRNDWSPRPRRDDRDDRKPSRYGADASASRPTTRPAARPAGRPAARPVGRPAGRPSGGFRAAPGRARPTG